MVLMGGSGVEFNKRLTEAGPWRWCLVFIHIATRGAIMMYSTGFNTTVSANHDGNTLNLNQSNNFLLYQAIISGVHYSRIFKEISYP